MGRSRQTHSRVIDGRRHVWDVERLWALSEGFPVRPVRVDSIREFDQDCWFGREAATIRAVASHCRRIIEADLTQPIILNADGTPMDGGHRVARALLDGVGELPAVRFEEMPEPDAVELA